MLFFRRLLGYGLLFVFVMQLGSCSPRLFRHAIAYFDANPPLGEPPFVAPDRHGITTGHKAALRRLPNLDSCIFSWGERPLWDKFPQDKILHDFAWNRIHDRAEVEVCLFRVLTQIGNPDDAEKWLREQGFSTYVFPPGTLHNQTHKIHAIWLIRAFGPKYRGISILERLLPSIPYSMTVDTQWSPDAEQLMSVRVTFSTL